MVSITLIVDTSTLFRDVEFATSWFQSVVSRSGLFNGDVRYTQLFYRGGCPPKSGKSITPPYEKTVALCGTEGLHKWITATGCHREDLETRERRLSAINSNTSLSAPPLNWRATFPAIHDWINSLAHRLPSASLTPKFFSVKRMNISNVHFCISFENIQKSGFSFFPHFHSLQLAEVLSAFQINRGKSRVDGYCVIISLRIPESHTFLKRKLILSPDLLDFHAMWYSYLL